MEITLVLTPNQLDFIKTYEEEPDTFNPTNDIDILWEIFEALSQAVTYDEEHQYKTKIYFSSFLQTNINAKNEEEAIILGRKKAQFLLNSRRKEFVDNAEPWEECDEAELLTK